MKAPFPYFGGKRRVAPIVWKAFGDVPNYVEPFAGSLAVLLERPNGPGKIETVNDIDRYLANFWRAVQAEPAEVARFADWPVNEADLHARHKWLVSQTDFRDRMHRDPDFYDARIAGWWVWGICQWIGGGWCAEPHNRKHPRLDGIGKGVHAKRPHLAGTSKGVHQLPKLERQAYSPGRRPRLSDAGSGVHLPALGNDRGINGATAPPCTEWFTALQERLRRVRVACGDWSRVLSPSVLGKGKNVGGRRPCAVFLDPPYEKELRNSHLYAEDAKGLSSLVREWAVANGDDPDLRIALCGYEGEHEIPDSWVCYHWKAPRGYAGADNDNRTRERIWFSPHCLPIESPQQRLFA